MTQFEKLGEHLDMLNKYLIIQVSKQNYFC